MGFSEHKTEWGGKPVADYDPQVGVTDPAGTAYRVSAVYEYKGDSESWLDRFARFLEDPRSSEVTSLLVGAWDYEDAMGDSEEIVAALAGAADRLPKLTSLFLGDITYEENEISWIQQSDVSPLFAAYPDLEHFGARGGTNLSLGRTRLSRLKTLVIETGGMPSALFEEAVSLDLPALEHLELWLGTDNYGGDVPAEAVAAMLANAPQRWPWLTYLGLRDSDIADEIAGALNGAAVLNQLSTLDLSMGTLGDEGATALLANPLLPRLKKLDIRHHYVSPELVARLESLGIEVDASDRQDPYEYGGEEHRYVAVGE